MKLRASPFEAFPEALERPDFLCSNARAREPAARGGGQRQRRLEELESGSSSSPALVINWSYKHPLYPWLNGWSLRWSLKLRHGYVMLRLTSSMMTLQVWIYQKYSKHEYGYAIMEEASSPGNHDVPPHFHGDREARIQFGMICRNLFVPRMLHIGLSCAPAS